MGPWHLLRTVAVDPGTRRRTHHLAKAVLMPAITARFASSPRGPGFRRTVAAQAFSWTGDLALNGSGRTSFLAGLSFFELAHLAYVSAYRSRSSEGVLATPGRRWFATVTGTAALGMGFAAGQKDRALGVPVAAYGATLAAMVAAAAAIDPARGRGPVLTGASLFLISDTLIGLRNFFVGAHSSALQAGVMVTYTAGQCCIGEGMAVG